MLKKPHTLLSPHTLIVSSRDGHERDALNTDSTLFLACLLFSDRYLAEFQSAEDRKTSASHALDAYKSASDLANQDLPPTHPIRLGLALNFSVFYYEILNSPERACNLAKAVSFRIHEPT